MFWLNVVFLISDLFGLNHPGILFVGFSDYAYHW